MSQPSYIDLRDRLQSDLIDLTKTDDEHELVRDAIRNSALSQSNEEPPLREVLYPAEFFDTPSQLYETYIHLAVRFNTLVLDNESTKEKLMIMSATTPKAIDFYERTYAALKARKGREAALKDFSKRMAALEDVSADDLERATTKSRGASSTSPSHMTPHEQWLAGMPLSDSDEPGDSMYKRKGRGGRGSAGSPRPRELDWSGDEDILQFRGRDHSRERAATQGSTSGSTTRGTKARGLRYTPSWNETF